MRHVHSDRIERWLGPQTHGISHAMRDWYGPPIALCGVPGKVCATRGGEFVGTLAGGRFACGMDAAAERIKRRWRDMSKLRPAELSVITTVVGLMFAAKNGRQSIPFDKAGSGVSAATGFSFWPVGNQPVAGSSGAAAPGGTANTNASAGAMAFANPGAGKSHLLGSSIAYPVTAAYFGGQLLLHDRIFSVAKTASSTATEAVTGVPTRYQNTTNGSADSAEGNFVFPEVITTLGGVAHNWTVCTYTDQSNNAGATLPSLTGLAAPLNAGGQDMPAATWFAPLASGDTGIKALTQMQCSASNTGALDFVIAHPLGWIPFYNSSFQWILDALLGGFNLCQIFDSACLALLNVNNPASFTVDLIGSVEVVQG